MIPKLGKIPALHGPEILRSFTRDTEFVCYFNHTFSIYFFQIKKMIKKFQPIKTPNYKQNLYFNMRQNKSFKNQGLLKRGRKSCRANRYVDT